MTAKPLAGLRVVELGQVLSAPFGGMIFAELGAEVVKVERPDGGDDARRMGPAHRGGDSITFHAFNRGKRSVTLDLGDPVGREGLDRLLEGADIFLHNLRPDVVGRFGIGPDALCSRFPRLVYCEVSAFGHKGPKRLDPGYEPLVQAFSGLSSINGFPDRPPVRTGPSICDLGTGMWVVIGAMAALRTRETTGRGGVVSASLLETALTWANASVDAYTNDGREPARYGTGQPNLVPYQTFGTADGDLMVAAGNDRLFAKLAVALGRPDLAADPRYAGNRDRLRHREELVGRLQETLLRKPRQEWAAALMAAGVPCSPVNTLPEALEEPQVAAMDIVTDVPGSHLRLVGLPLHFNGERPGPRHPAPLLGEHNQIEQVDALMLQAASQPLVEHVVHPSSTAVHGDAHPGSPHHVGEVVRGE